MVTYTTLYIIIPGYFYVFLCMICRKLFTSLHMLFQQWCDVVIFVWITYFYTHICDGWGGRSWLSKKQINRFVFFDGCRCTHDLNRGLFNILPTIFILHNPNQTAWKQKKVIHYSESPQYSRSGLVRFTHFRDRLWSARTLLTDRFYLA